MKQKTKAYMGISISILALAIICVVILNGGNETALDSEINTTREPAISDVSNNSPKMPGMIDIGAKSIAWYSPSHSIPLTVYELNRDSATVPEDDGEIVCFETSCFPPMSLSELLTQSTLIVYGRVTQKELIYIQSVQGGDPCGHTDYYIEPISILRGEPINDDEIIVRVRTGQIKGSDMTVIIQDQAELNVGDEYLLFLGRAEQGGGYNTEGDQYFILRTNQGLFTVSEGSIQGASGHMLPVKSAGMFNSIELSYEKLESKIEKANIVAPADPYYHRDAELNNYRTQLESGYIVQEEYDSIMYELNQYATIVE